MPDQLIKVGDIVYQTKKGWSGIPMEVVEIKGYLITCKGAKGCGLNGLWSDKHGAYITRYARAFLTHTPDSAIGGNK